MTKKIALGGDHAGVELKAKIIEYLNDLGFETIDKGPYSNDSVDYPDFVHPVCESIIGEEVDYGILICGSGNGVAMTANKYSFIRCGLCWTPEIAALTKQHNNANVIAIPARFISEDVALQIVKTFVESRFEGGRHDRRVKKIAPSNNQREINPHNSAC